MNSHVFLHSGYYWSAGQEFGWPKKDAGVGIDMRKIKDALPDGRIYVKSTYDYLSISAELAMEEIKKYKSTMLRGTKEIGVIPKSKFRKEGTTREEGFIEQLEAEKASKFKGMPLFERDK